VENLERGGLESEQCFRFLLEQPKRHILVCFGLGYDVNNWLRDLPRDALERLWAENNCYWKDYRLEWIPGCWFKVQHIGGLTVTVNEVFRFFQTSFVKSLEAWKIEAPDVIARMKLQRGSFKRQEFAEVKHYCLQECQLLTDLMEQLRAVCKEVGVVPRKWIGAGALANALLNKQQMGTYHAHDLDIASQTVAEGAILGAYYAGRIELIHQGVHSNIQTVDIRSAYPSATMALPSLAGAKLVHRKRFTRGTHGIFRVRWDCKSDSTLLSPFPVRQKQSIYWPSSGEGWYHGVEVEAALDCGYPVEVLEGWVLKHSGEQPFRWVESIYRERARLKNEGRAAEKVLKLGLNSIYGKLAQGQGFKGAPQWQSYFWAGYITAATRAKVLRAATASKGIVMVSTDGIFCKQPGVRASNKLGGWEFGKVQELFAAQAGVYQGINPDQEILKSRGFFAAEVDYDALREGWEIEGSNYIYHYESTRFMGLGISLMRKDFSVWRTWRTDRRALSLAPERKEIGQAGILTPCRGPLVSEPYVPKVSLSEQQSRELETQLIEGRDQPLKTEF
jgi:hypothetical protein